MNRGLAIPARIRYNTPKTLPREVLTLEKTQHPIFAAIRTAFPHTLPVLTGYLVLGIAYGVLMQTHGYGVPWVLLMCCVAYCGSMQFVAISLLTAAFDPIQAFLMSLMVNARHLFYGISMLGRYRGMGVAKLPLIYTLSDETFSIVSSVEPPEGTPRRDFYLAVSLLNYGYWAAGSVLGAVAGRFITFDTTGLDFALTGLFVVLFIEQVTNPKNRASGIIGLACTAAALAVFGADNLVIPAMALVLIVLLIGRNKL